MDGISNSFDLFACMDPYILTLVFFVSKIQKKDSNFLFLSTTILFDYNSVDRHSYLLNLNLQQNYHYKSAWVTKIKIIS